MDENITKNKKQTKIIIRFFITSMLLILLFSCMNIISGNDSKSVMIDQDREQVIKYGSKFHPIVSFGHDINNNVHGIWFIANTNNSISAFYSRDPNNGCNLRFRKDIQINNTSPVFFSICDKTYFSIKGEQLSSQNQELDQFIINDIGDKVSVSIEEVKYGVCTNLQHAGLAYCSTQNKQKYGKPKPGKQIGQK